MPYIIGENKAGSLPETETYYTDNVDDAVDYYINMLRDDLADRINDLPDDFMPDASSEEIYKTLRGVALKEYEYNFDVSILEGIIRAESTIDILYQMDNWKNVSFLETEICGYYFWLRKESD